MLTSNRGRCLWFLYLIELTQQPGAQFFLLTDRLSSARRARSVSACASAVRLECCASGFGLGLVALGFRAPQRLTRLGLGAASGVSSA
jgi:hypothetical protein